MKIKFKNNGFTLVELMVVLILIGIIVGFALPSYNIAIQKANERDAVLQLTALHAANRIYFAQTRSYYPGVAISEATLNTGLGINIIANGKTYLYTSPKTGLGSDTFATSVNYLQGATSVFKIAIDESNVNLSTGNPCCCAGFGTCKLLTTNCTFTCP